jgi:hypothetical protein
LPHIKGREQWPQLVSFRSKALLRLRLAKFTKRWVFNDYPVTEYVCIKHTILSMFSCQITIYNNINRETFKKFPFDIKIQLRHAEHKNSYVHKRTLTGVKIFVIFMHLLPKDFILTYAWSPARHSKLHNQKAFHELYTYLRNNFVK